MRVGRIKVDARQAEAVYHCVTRVVNGEWLIDEPAREVLRRQLWVTAEYCGLEILTYAILSNHFHILVRVPLERVPGDAELLRRFRLLHPRPTPYQLESLEVIAGELACGSAQGQAWRRRQLAQMGDVSAFMKLLKQRFAIWFNRTHKRFGTLYAERFKSVLVEARGQALRTVALYIDLNAVRAGLVADPKDYRYCGYGEAVGGSRAARQGLCGLYGCPWSQAQQAHRLGLFGTGAQPREGAAAIDAAALEQVVAQKGKLALFEVLRCRLRYFTDGAVLGSGAFVQAQLVEYRRRHGRRERTAPRPLAPVTDWGGLTCLRGLRRCPFG